MITYFTFPEHGMPGNTDLFAEPDGNGPDEVKKYSMETISDEEMVWIAPSPGDISKNIILESGTNANGGVHRGMCLRGKFLPLIGEKYPNSGYFSCTDPTVAHYARDTAQFLEEAGLATLKGDDTPPKVSQLRLIRAFWGVLKQDVYRGGSVASSEAQLKRVIAIALKKIAPEVPPTMMRGVSLHVRSVNRNGLMPMVHRIAWGTQSPNVSVLKIW